MFETTESERDRTLMGSSSSVGRFVSSSMASSRWLIFSQLVSGSRMLERNNRDPAAV